MLFSSYKKTTPHKSPLGQRLVMNNIFNCCIHIGSTAPHNKSAIWIIHWKKVINHKCSCSSRITDTRRFSPGYTASKLPRKSTSTAQGKGVFHSKPPGGFSHLRFMVHSFHSKTESINMSKHSKLLTTLFTMGRLSQRVRGWWRSYINHFEIKKKKKNLILIQSQCHPLAIIIWKMISDERN